MTPTVADFRLDNGLRVLVAPTDGVPLVSARLSFDAGSSDDPTGKAGVAAMTAALLTQGTKTRTAPEIATQIEQLGASVGASAGVDFSNVYANAPSNAFPATVALMADLVKNPTFAGEELERQQAQTLDGLRVALSQPASIAGMTVGRVIYGDAPYGATITQQTVPAITAADVAASTPPATGRRTQPWSSRATSRRPPPALWRNRPSATGARPARPRLLRPTRPVSLLLRASSW